MSFRAAVIIPTRNRSGYLFQTLGSLGLGLERFPRGVSLIVCDNASDDPGYHQVAGFLAQYPWARYLRFETLLPMLSNWNRCLAQARGMEYVALYHDDDLYDPDIISKQVEFLDLNPNVGIVGTDSWIIDEHGKVTGQWPYGDVPAITPGRQFINDSILKYRVFLNCPSVMCRAKALGDQPFDPDLPPGGGDYATWLKVAEDWDVGYINEKLLYYRRHSNQGSLENTPESGILQVHQSYLHYVAGYEARYPEDASRVLGWRRGLEDHTAFALFRVGLNQLESGGQLGGVPEALSTLKSPRARAYKVLLGAGKLLLDPKIIKYSRAVLRRLRGGLGMAR